MNQNLIKTRHDVMPKAVQRKLNSAETRNKENNDKRKYKKTMSG